MKKFKLPLLISRVLQLLLTIYVLSTITSQVYIWRAFTVELLVQTILATLIVLFTAVALCWSTCCDGMRFMAVVGIVGDIVSVVLSATVAGTSGIHATARCEGREDSIVFLGNENEIRVVERLSGSELQRACVFGKSTLGVSIFNWYEPFPCDRACF